MIDQCKHTDRHRDIFRNMNIYLNSRECIVLVTYFGFYFYKIVFSTWPRQEPFQ